MLHRRLVAPVLALCVLAAGALAQDLSTWNRKLDDGLKAAKKSGKPVLFVTNWKPDT